MSKESYPTCPVCGEEAPEYIISNWATSEVIGCSECLHIEDSYEYLSRVEEDELADREEQDWRESHDY